MKEINVQCFNNAKLFEAISQSTQNVKEHITSLKGAYNESTETIRLLNKIYLNYQSLQNK